ncbi:MAG: hypothetical protein AAF725_21705 [Acidobacteriota bacterium]
MLTKAEVVVDEERNSRKNPLSDEEAQAILGEVSRVLVAKGKKVREIAVGDCELADLKGPTGNYRAPIVRAGDTLIVGFHADTLKSLFAS